MSSSIEPRLCIFIPSYNARDFLQATVKRIPWTSLPPGMHYELLFIDNASTDGTPAAIAAIRTELKEKMGYARMRGCIRSIKAMEAASRRRLASVSSTVLIL